MRGQAGCCSVDVTDGAAGVRVGRAIFAAQTAVSICAVLLFFAGSSTATASKHILILCQRAPDNQLLAGCGQGL